MSFSIKIISFFKQIFFIHNCILLKVLTLCEQQQMEIRLVLASDQFALQKILKDHFLLLSS